MIRMQGRGASPGTARGPLAFFRRVGEDCPRRTVEDPSAENRRFEAARRRAVEELEDLARRTREAAGEEAAFLFETYAMMCEDRDFLQAVSGRITGERLNAEAAVADAAREFAAMFTALEDPTLQARAEDVLDVGRRLIAALTGAGEESLQPEKPVVLAAEDLSPSETARLDRSRILALLTREGSENGHAAILARALGIPAVMGLGEGLPAEYRGREVLVDGDAGVVILDPDEEAVARFRAEEVRRREERAALRAQADLEGGVRVTCNISGPEDVPAVLENGGQGVGLLRTEFLFLGRESLPTEEEQTEAYRRVLQGMGDREVRIRTLDLGADKQAPCLPLPREANPALGCRGLRLCLEHPRLFRTQLRALYRASVFGRLGILFPMVTALWEVREAKALCARVREELAAEGVPFSPEVALGVMIETPAAALLSDELAREVDFFSCGTNDLTQYTLACDRQNSRLARFADPLHPAVFRLLETVCANARAQGVGVAVCGDLAADLRATRALLALGVEELSVPPAMVLPLRQSILRGAMSSEQ